jgi:hypothetical protein
MFAKIVLALGFALTLSFPTAGLAQEDGDQQSGKSFSEAECKNMRERLAELNSRDTLNSGDTSQNVDAETEAEIQRLRSQLQHCQ